MARPTKTEAIAIKKRDEEMLEMDRKNYPLDYISAYFSLSKGRIVQIIKKKKERDGG